jgi:hypothetical protein
MKMLFQLVNEHDSRYLVQGTASVDLVCDAKTFDSHARYPDTRRLVLRPAQKNPMAPVFECQYDRASLSRVPASATLIQQAPDRDSSRSRATVDQLGTLQRSRVVEQTPEAASISYAGAGSLVAIDRRPAPEAHINT